MSDGDVYGITIMGYESQKKELEAENDCLRRKLADMEEQLEVVKDVVKILEKEWVLYISYNRGGNIPSAIKRVFDMLSPLVGNKDES